MRNYLRHAWWNGFGINLLNVNIISLLAISYGATNLQLGYLSSVFHLSGIVLVFLPRLLRGANIRDVFFYAWALRGLVAFLYAGLFFVSGQIAVVLIMVVYSAFAVFRSVGIPMQPLLQKRIVRPSEEGRLVSQLHVRLSATQLLSQVVGFALLSLETLIGTGVLVLIPLLGAGSNTVGSFYISRIPSRDRVEYRRGQNVVVLFGEAMRHAERSRVLIMHWLGISVLIVYAFGIAFLRREVGMPANMVFLYTIAVALAAIVASNFMRPFADRIGSKPLVTITYTMLTVTALVWVVLPPTLPWAVYYALGFVCYFFLRLELLLVSRLVIRSLPGENRIGYTSMMHFFAAITALVVGMLAGALADLGLALPQISVHQYSFTFALAALLCIAAVVSGIRLHDAGSMSIRETASIFLSVQNLRAFLDIYHLDASADPVRREASLLSLERSASQLATGEIRRRLRTPVPSERRRILRSLAGYPRPVLQPELIEEAQDRDSFSRLEAISALGSYRSQQTIAALREFAQESDPAVQAAALRALAAAGSAAELTAALQLAQRPDLAPWIRADAVAAVLGMDTSSSCIGLLFDFAPPDRGRRYRQAVMALFAERYRFEPDLADCFRRENEQRSRGFRSLLTETRRLALFDQSAAQLLEHYREQRHAELRSWCAAALQNATVPPPLDLLAVAVSSQTAPHSTEPQADDDTTLVMLYATYQCLKAAAA